MVKALGLDPRVYRFESCIGHIASMVKSADTVDLKSTAKASRFKSWCWHISVCGETADTRFSKSRAFGRVGAIPTRRTKSFLNSGGQSTSVVTRMSRVRISEKAP